MSKVKLAHTTRTPTTTTDYDQQHEPTSVGSHARGGGSPTDGGCESMGDGLVREYIRSTGGRATERRTCC